MDPTNNMGTTMLNELLISAALLGGNTFHDSDSDMLESGYQIHQRGNDSFSAKDKDDRLTEEEREFIVKAWHLAVIKMNYLMDQAHTEANLIFEVKIRNATVGVISGAITSLPSQNPYAITLGACLGGLANIAGDSYLHFAASRDYVKQAKFYGKVADDLQEQLWRG